MKSTRVDVYVYSIWVVLCEYIYNVKLEKNTKVLVNFTIYMAMGMTISSYLPIYDKETWTNAKIQRRNMSQNITRKNFHNLIYNLCSYKS